MGTSAAAEDDMKALKNAFEVLEKLRGRRKEIKAQLAKELKDSEEKELAEELSELSAAIYALDVERRRVVKAVGKEKL